MNPWFLFALTWLVALPETQAAETTRPRLGDLLHLPPVMAREIGNPPVDVRPASGRGRETIVTLRRPPLRSGQCVRIESIRVEPPKGSSSWRPALAEALLEHFWDRHAEAIETGKDTIALVTMNRQRFVKVGLARLTGKSGPDPVGHAWWKVRMDEPLTPDKDHQLIVMTAKSPAEFYSHFALGLRENGSIGRRGDDWVLDPRAPWLKDTHPTMLDWFNMDNSMLMTVEVSHLPDWLYTQTAYRGYGVTMQFTPATKEYVTLLKAAGRGEHLRTLNLGPFKPFRHNCATHGQQLVEALLPMGEKLCGPHPLADLPKRLMRKSERQFGKVTTVAIPPQPAPPGVTQSQNSTLRVCPDPTAIPEVRQLREVPEINGR
ncbi:MAG: hypothetical protein KGS60_04545 [Verrucomicrobia bacterium]|nr:hypothetical protein [Verrucomicrobiota bacterium]